MTAEFAALAEAIDGLGSLGTAELLARPDLQTRVDRKYVLPADVAAEVVSGSMSGWHVLDVDGKRSFGYRSLYYDTPEFESFRSSATGRRRRFKVRLRTYLADGRQTIETKTMGPRGLTVKQRLALDARHDDEPLSPAVHGFVDSSVGRSVAGALTPVVITEYRRATLISRVTDARVTIDVDVRGARPASPAAPLTRHAIVETKTAGSPSTIDRRLWAHGVRPMRVSKFGIAMVMSYPELPSNRWHRVLVEHCEWR